MPENKRKSTSSLVQMQAWKEQRGFCRRLTLNLCEVERKGIPMAGRASISRELGRVLGAGQCWGCRQGPGQHSRAEGRLPTTKLN